jgi:hypothetical protein
MTKQLTLITALCMHFCAGLHAQTKPDPQPGPANQKPAGLYQRSAGPQNGHGREDFFHSSGKLVNKSDYDWGAWLAERRRAFVEASVGNPFFWYSALTTVVLMLLMTAYGVRVLDEKRKLWRAAEILTDVWNQDQYSRAIAHAAVERHNRHMLECNRVVEAQFSGRPSAVSLETSDAREELLRIRGELDNIDSERKSLRSELEKKERMVSDLSARLSALEKDGQGNSVNGGTDSGNMGRLVARVNQLTQQLDAERQKNRSLKGA